MARNRLGKHRNPLALFGAVLLLSAMVGIWQADRVEHDRLAQLDTSYVSDDASCVEFVEEKTYLVEMQKTLAQAGCPGWMTLASEGEAALQSANPGEEIKQVAHSQPVTTPTPPELSVPRVTYPVPVRVASLPRISVALREAHPVEGSPDDPDDLLDGQPDLLNLPEESPVEDSKPVSPSPAASPVESAPVEAPAEPQPPVQNQPPAAEKRPAVPPTPEPSGPRLELPAIEMPADDTPVEQAPVLKAPVQQTPVFDPPPGGSIVEPSIPEQVTPQPIAPTPQVTKPEPIAPPTSAPFSPPPRPSAPHSVSTPNAQDNQKTHCEFVADNCFPTAEACSKCHEKIYDEWRVSSHAYAAISPMFHKFEQKINDLSNGTIGYFCYRCHMPVGTTMGVSRVAPLWELPQVAREGVTCVACHRVNQRYGKVNGERRIEAGNIHAPVYGSIGGGGVAEVIARKDEFKVKTHPNEPGPGQDIHVAGYGFEQLSKPEFCVSCHQVAVHPGIKLEVVWEQYRASPACKKGISCQDCHMGRLPGVASGYEIGAAAVVNGKSVNKHRKHANHVFYGPGYSIAHPGVFPHNPKAKRWSMRDWLLFDYRNGWGTDDFEDRVANGQIRLRFPPAWAEADDRYDAREIVEENLAKLSEKAVLRQQLMENGSHVDGPFFDSSQARGRDLEFHYIITNTNEGHNLPSGSLGAQPQLWANVVLIGPRGNRLWESGYTDRWGDVADIHSEDVRHKRIPYDWQLFNLQTMFLITGAKGTDREFPLPVNVDFDQLPYLRPGAQPISVLNHPPFIRMEGRSLAPLGSRQVPYKVPGHLMQEPGCYRLSFRMRSRAEPIYFMRFCDATKEMQQAMNEWMIDFHQSSVEFIVR